MHLEYSQAAQLSNKWHDICIIGAGAAGLAIASSLSKSNTQICIIESGPATPLPSYQQLNSAESVGIPYDYLQSRYRGLGGTLNKWSGTLAPFDPIDFRHRTWMPDSGWPIGNHTLDPYYNAALRFFDIPQAKEIFSSMPPAASQQISSVIPRDGGLVPKPFLLTHSRVASHVKKLQANIFSMQNVVCISKATVTNISCGDNGRIDHVVVKSFEDTRILKIYARVFVLCTGGLETPRLMLASRYPNGKSIGNGNGMVGRYFMDHVRLRSTSIQLKERSKSPVLSNLKIGSALGLRCGFSILENLQEQWQIGNHTIFFAPLVNEEKNFLIRFLRILKKQKDIKEHRPQANEKGVECYRNLKAVWRHMPPQLRLTLEQASFPRTFTQLAVVAKIEQSPNRTSRITLSREEDKFGVPKLKVEWRLNDFDRIGINCLRNNICKMMCGIEDAYGTFDFIRHDGDYVCQDSSHPAGATRMASNASEGVVDTNLKCFEISNLYICSSAVFPTEGSANPTLTLVALAKRLAHHLHGELARG